MKDYHINIFWSDEDGGYIADVPDLVACSAFGRTAAEALASVERAKEAWLKAAPRRGEADPAPAQSAGHRQDSVMNRKRKPVAALKAVASSTDLENLAVSNDPGFKALIERSRRLYPVGTGLSTTEVRRRLGLARRRARR
jgi:predicted RNase H-like HicB family nuclease